jgi:hypothetical protein
LFIQNRHHLEELAPNTVNRRDLRAVGYGNVVWADPDKLPILIMKLAIVLRGVSIGHHGQPVEARDPSKRWTREALEAPTEEVSCIVNHNGCNEGDKAQQEDVWLHKRSLVRAIDGC